MDAPIVRAGANGLLDVHQGRVADPGAHWGSARKKPMISLTPELLRRFDVPGPRYTSYPTADRFVEAFAADAYKQALAQRGTGLVGRLAPLSLYVHVPFCASLCYYCACNKIITKHAERADEYLDYLERELDLQLAHVGGRPTISQLHLGGGSPTF